MHVAVVNNEIAMSKAKILIDVVKRSSSMSRSGDFT